MTLRLTLKRNKMLKSSIAISELFTKIPAKNILSRDFLLLRFNGASQQSTSFKHQVIVSKKLFRKASDRNLVKRRLREAVRINQSFLKTDASLHFLVVYRSKKIKSFQEIDSTIKALFVALNDRLPTKH